MDNLFNGKIDSIKKENKANIVYDILYEAIIFGTLKRGDRLYDDELSKRLGTSRNSVREALSILVKNHLVEKEHWKGYKIRAPQWEEIEEAIELREYLELYAIEKLRKLPDEKIENIIKSLNNHFSEAKKMVETNQNEYRKIDKMFHQIIYNSVSGFWLTDIIENLNAIADIRTNRLYVSFQEHQDIYNKLLERDFDGMKIKMQKHLESFKIRAQNAFQSNL